MKREEFDYVVIGGGSAGATLASRLASNSEASVCLLEAGGPSHGLKNRIPVLFTATVPGYLRGNNWRYKTIEQAALNGRRGYQPRGKGLGGSSLINAMIYVRGQAQDYQHWQDQGAEGWDYQSVLPYFIKSENNANGSSAYHGDSGPLQVSNLLDPQPASLDFVKAGERLGMPLNNDFNGPEQTGVGLYQSTRYHSGPKRGERCSTVAAFLSEPPDNLTILCHSSVRKVLIEKGRAIGVEFSQNGKARSLRVNKEVVLSAGAFVSPQILMLSGVGDPKELAKHGIECKASLPGVGQNLQDHIDVFLPFKAKENIGLTISLGAIPTHLKSVANWMKNRRGIISSNLAESGAFVDSTGGGGRPDTQLHFAVSHAENHGRSLHWGHGGGVHACCLRPTSVGEVTLNSANPADVPRIDPKFLTTTEDMDTTIRAGKLAYEMMQQADMKRYGFEPLRPMKSFNDNDWRNYITQRADTIYHPIGTCKIGSETDPMAVVDSQLRVRGVEGLRVADASVMPSLISGNTNAPSIMIGERAADFILGA